MLRVAVVSGTRADYGLLRPTLQALSTDRRFELSLLVTAMHLLPEYGTTIEEIEADGVAIAERVPFGRPVRALGDVGHNLGQATIAFTEALGRCAPDFLVVLGDRFEILAAALAATGLSIPIAHIHGGELSEGSLDDATRHCVTKLSHLHFVAARVYGERVCQLGEQPERVHVVGAAGLESILGLALLDREALAAQLGVGPLKRPLLSLTLHAASLEPETATTHAAAVTGAVDDVLGASGTVILTLPNDDPGSRSVREAVTAWERERANVHAFASLGQLRYLTLLAHADAIVGNSSSAVLEAPAFRLPAVNVGDRQRGRLLADNVITVAPDRQEVAAGLRRALDPAFRNSLAAMENPYGDGQVSQRILEVLAAAPPAAVLRAKRFLDLPDTAWREQLALADDQ